MSIRIRQRIPGLLDADLDIPSRGVTAVIGASGAGKTLLLRCIAGLERGAEGVITVGEEEWHARPPHERPVGFVFQEPSLFPHLTVRRNLEFSATRRKRAGTATQVVAARLGLEDLLDRRPERLSGGEAQRVAIARALLTDADLLLMDEPVSALDPDARREVLRYIVDLRGDAAVPILYVTHDIDEVARLADHLALLERGRVVASGTLEEMLTRLDLPLSHSEDAESVIPGRCSAWDSEHRLVSVHTAAGVFRAVSDDVRLGSPVRLRIKARDVSLALSAAEGTSILNILPARVAGVSLRDPGKAVVLLDAGGARMLAHLSRMSTESLGIAEGREVFVQVKSVAVLA